MHDHTNIKYLLSLLKLFSHLHQIFPPGGLFLQVSSRKFSKHFSITCPMHLKLFTSIIRMIFEEGYKSYAWNIRLLLNDVFPDRWISSAVPFASSPLSSVLTPLNCFIWGQVKTLVCTSTPRSVVELTTGSQTHFIT